MAWGEVWGRDCDWGGSGGWGGGRVRAWGPEVTRDRGRGQSGLVGGKGQGRRGQVGFLGFLGFLRVGARGPTDRFLKQI